MRTARNYRPPFTPGMEAMKFMATPPVGRKRGLPISGREFGHGDVIDASLLSPRRLRQLYEQRLVALVPGQEPPKKAARRLAVGPTDNLHPGRASPPPPKTVKRRLSRVRRVEPAQQLEA